MEYNTDLFDAATISSDGAAFSDLDGRRRRQSRAAHLDVTAFDSSRTAQLLVEWNDTQADYPEDLCVHQMFEAQVERTPDAVAVIFEDERLTYQELNARANQLATTCGHGVGPEVLVGICMERSVEMVVGLLGILKAGGAYVPLDPTYPRSAWPSC